MLNFVSIVLIVLSVPTILYCEMVSYQNYKVFRLIPMTVVQIKVLQDLGNRHGFSFWIEPSRVQKFVDLQVAPTHLPFFYVVVTRAKIRFQLLIRDIQPLINKQLNTIRPRAGGTVFDFTRYHTLEEIYTWMDMLALVHLRNVEKIVGGRTYQGREIKGVRLTFGMSNPGIYIEAGLNPRSWISPATAIYLIDQLLNSKKPEVRHLAESYDWYILPVCNPDGYVHTHNTDRMWPKSLSNTGAGPNPTDSRCKGVNLNRNWGYKWQEESEPITDPCSDRYPGRRAFSEFETKTLSEFINSISGKLFAYISFHSYRQVLMIPYGYTIDHLDNYEESLAIGSRAITALSRQYGTRYSAGTFAEEIFYVTGSALDWVKGEMKLDLAFTYELRDTGFTGFLLPPELIIPNGEEILDSLVAMFEEAKSLGYPKNKGSTSGPGESSDTTNKGKFQLPRCLSRSRSH